MGVHQIIHLTIGHQITGNLEIDHPGTINLEIDHLSTINIEHLGIDHRELIDTMKRDITMVINEKTPKGLTDKRGQNTD